MADQQPDVAGPSPLISLAEAARLTGRHPEALRALVRRGRLTAQRGNNGRLLLRLADLPVTLPADLPNPAAAEHQPAERPATAGHVADLEILVGDLRDELLEAHLRIGRLEAERDAATGLSEARMDAVRAQVVAKEERILELKAMLAEARRPWWRRLIGALLLAGSLSTVGAPAHAQSNGMDLLSYCKEAMEMRERGVDYAAGMRGVSCSHYIRGFVDGWIQGLAVRNGVEREFCIPLGATYDQFVNIYVRWGDTHPERLHLETNRAVHEAMAQAFPCN